MYINIFYKNKYYKIKQENLDYIISVLEDKTGEKIEDYHEFLIKYGLYNEFFLKNINKIIKTT